jgi:hypothetical protein
MSWNLQKLEWCCGQPTINHEEVFELAIELSTFIKHCPDDFLEPLMNSPFGRIYSLFTEKCCTISPPTSAAITFRDELSKELRLSGLKTSEGQRLLLALMPFYPNGAMSVEDAVAKLPEWLYKIYSKRYEEINNKESPVDLTQNDSEQPGFSNRIFLNRVLGLSNLFYIDPEDQEIRDELKEVRSQCIDLLVNCNSTELGNHFNGDFGDRFWAMAQSGIQKEDLNAKEATQRDAIQNWLTSTPNSLHQEGGIQRFAAIILFSQPGSIQLSNAEQNLPTWFLEGFKRYTSMSAA